MDERLMQIPEKRAFSVISLSLTQHLPQFEPFVFSL